MMMVVMASSSSAIDGLRQVLQIGELAARGGVGEVRRQLIELAGASSIAVRGIGFRSALQVGRDLRRHLLILGGIGLLKALKLAQELRQRGN